jgi:hypothetical protein
MTSASRRGSGVTWATAFESVPMASASSRPWRIMSVATRAGPVQAGAIGSSVDGKFSCASHVTMGSGQFVQSLGKPGHLDPVMGERCPGRERGCSASPRDRAPGAVIRSCFGLVTTAFRGQVRCHVSCDVESAMKILAHRTALITEILRRASYKICGERMTRWSRRNP